MEKYVQIFEQSLSTIVDGCRVKRLTITAKGSTKYCHVRTFQHEKEDKFTTTYEGVALNCKQTFGLFGAPKLGNGEPSLYLLGDEAWIGAYGSEIMFLRKKQDGVNGIMLTKSEYEKLFRALPVITYVMLPPLDLCDKNIMFAAAAAVMREELSRLNIEKCEGCLNNYPAQRDHHCLKADGYFRIRYMSEASVDMSLVKQNFDYLARTLQKEALFSEDVVREILKE